MVCYFPPRTTTRTHSLTHNHLVWMQTCSKYYINTWNRYVCVCVCARNFIFIFHSFILSTIKRVSSTWCLLTHSHIFNCSGGGYVRVYLSAYVAQSSDGIHCVFHILYSCYATVLWTYKWSLCILTMRLFIALFAFSLSFARSLFTLSKLYYNTSNNRR